MRVLTDHELTLVSGGTTSSDDGDPWSYWDLQFDAYADMYLFETSNDDIVCQGVRMGSADASFFAATMFSGGVLEPGDGAGVDDQNLWQTLLKEVVLPVLTAIIGRAVKSHEQQEADEKAVAQTMQGEPRAIGHYTTNDGKTGTMFNMADGTVFWDTNGNGTADYHTRYNTDGSLWGTDDGKTWSMISQNPG